MPLDIEASPSAFMAAYAKQYHAGAFATPTRAEVNSAAVLVDEEHWADNYPTASRRGGRVVIARKRLKLDSHRSDFTGRLFTLPAGATVALVVAHTPNVLPSSTTLYDYVMAYAEDRPLCEMLAAEGRNITATRVTAAAEVIHCYGPPGLRGRTNAVEDLATVTPMPFYMGDRERAKIAAELGTVTGWDDDFPYYSDGSWSAVCLKGFWPDEPGRGVKPAEMPRSWKEAHLEDLMRECTWTSLSVQLPALMTLVNSITWIRRTERVRLLRMAPGGSLGRHTDITDRFGGTRDGMITRFHIPLTTHPETKLITWDLDGLRHERHLEPYNCYYLDARKPHAVDNGPVERIHLVIDAVTDLTVRRSIALAHLTELEHT